MSDLMEGDAIYLLSIKGIVRRCEECEFSLWDYEYCNNEPMYYIRGCKKDNEWNKCKDFLLRDKE